MKRISIVVTTLFVCSVMLLQTGLAAEKFAGQPVHDQNCMECHGNEMYQRNPLFVKSYRQLDAQVKACAKRNKINLTEDQAEEVIDYLCDAFYGFE